MYNFFKDCGHTVEVRVDFICPFWVEDSWSLAWQIEISNFQDPYNPRYLRTSEVSSLLVNGVVGWAFEQLVYIYLSYVIRA